MGSKWYIVELNKRYSKVVSFISRITIGIRNKNCECEHVNNLNSIIDTVLTTTHPGGERGQDQGPRGQVPAVRARN